MPPESNLQSTEDADLTRAVEQCGQTDAFLQALLDVYANVEQASTKDETLCMGGGACCRFDMFDHRLYVTLGELALLRRIESADRSRIARNRCPYQRGPRCMARENRPLGCRIFFCREKPEIRDNDTYEAHHKRICELHENYNLPYAYMELITALKILDKFCR